MISWKRTINANVVPAMELVLDSMPQCTPEQIILFTFDVLTDQDDPLPVCRPPVPFYSTLIASGSAVLPVVVASYPDEIIFGEGFAEESQGWEQLKLFLQSTRLMAGIGWILVLA